MPKSAFFAEIVFFFSQKEAFFSRAFFSSNPLGGLKMSFPGTKLLEVQSKKGKTAIDLAGTEEMKHVLLTTTQLANIPRTPSKTRPDSQGNFTCTTYPV